jgi:hypothetical protein
MTPTQLSLRYLERSGWTAAVVEKWNPFAHIRQDLFGFADILAFKQGEPVTLVQTTTADNTSKRVKKIKANETATAWTGAGNQIVVHGWKKNPKSRRWELTRDVAC